MPDTFIRFSDMKDSHPSPIDGANDLLAIAHKDINSPTGYTSMTTTPNALGAHAIEDQTFVNLETGSKTVEGAINQTLGNFANKYDATQTYAVDDCVLYAGILYKCIVAISTPEAWDSTHWEQIKAIDVGSGGGGSSADHITLTQAEYDALVEAGTVDPDAFYFIKDTNGDGQNFQPVIYSLEEREIGVWTDGKPLYERTYYHAGAVTGLVAIPHGISDLERVVSFKGSVLDSNATPSDYTRYALPRVASDGYNIGLDVVSDTDIRVAVPAIFGTRLYGWYVTIQYIKSSDTPGSGTWTPQGVPAVHYSTDEQVVGIWVDGSTVYEKTFNITTPSAGVTSIAHNISNIGDVINIEGTAIRSNGAVQPLGFISSANNYGWNATVYDFSTANFTLEVGSQLSLSKVIVTIRYTKTST